MVEFIMNEVKSNISLVTFSVSPFPKTSLLQVRDEKTRRHPCLTSFQQLPPNEKTYNINLAIDTMK